MTGNLRRLTIAASLIFVMMSGLALLSWSWSTAVAPTTPAVLNTTPHSATQTNTEWLKEYGVTIVRHRVVVRLRWSSSSSHCVTSTLGDDDEAIVKIRVIRTVSRDFTIKLSRDNASDGHISSCKGPSQPMIHCFTKNHWLSSLLSYKVNETSSMIVAESPAVSLVLADLSTSDNSQVVTNPSRYICLCWIVLQLVNCWKIGRVPDGFETIARHGQYKSD